MGGGGWGGAAGLGREGQLLVWTQACGGTRAQGWFPGRCPAAQSSGDRRWREVPVSGERPLGLLVPLARGCVRSHRTCVAPAPGRRRRQEVAPPGPRPGCLSSREVPGLVTLVEWNVLIEIFSEINKAFPRLFAGKLGAWKLPEGGQPEKSHNEMEPRLGASPGVGGGGRPHPRSPARSGPSWDWGAAPRSSSLGRRPQGQASGRRWKEPRVWEGAEVSVLAGAGGLRPTPAAPRRSRSLPRPHRGLCGRRDGAGGGGSRCASVYLRHLGRQGWVVVWVT